MDAAAALTVLPMLERIRTLLAADWCAVARIDPEPAAQKDGDPEPAAQKDGDPAEGAVVLMPETVRPPSASATLAVLAEPIFAVLRPALRRTGGAPVPPVTCDFGAAMPVQPPQRRPSGLAGVLFVGNVGRRPPWTDEQRLLLRIGQDLAQAALAHPEVFVTLDARIAQLPADELRDSLPEADRAVVDRIVRLVERVRRRSEIGDHWEDTGREAVVAKIGRCVVARQAVRLVLPAFPMKSPDREQKVLGDLPDAGELLALLTLDRLARDIAAVYEPGCKLLVVSDGRVFNDLYVVPDDAVSRYSSTLRRLAPEDHLQFIGLDELFASMDSAAKREAVVAFAAKDPDQVMARQDTDPHFLAIYTAFKRLLTDDTGLRRAEAAAIGKVMMLRNDSYSDLVRVLFPHHVRLSIHEHSGVEKIGIHLVGQSLITPWHGVAVRHRDGSWSIVRRRAAEEAGWAAHDLAQATDLDDVGARMCELARRAGLGRVLYYPEP